LLEFFFCFSFLFLFSQLVTCVCCQCTHQGGDWGTERPRTGGWLLLAVMSDWQRGVDGLLAEYCRCRLWLDLLWCRWRVDTKGLCLVGPPRSGETSRPDSRDPVASGVKCGPHGGKKPRRSCRLSRWRVAAHGRSLHTGFATVHQKIVGLLGWATKPRPEAQRNARGLSARWLRTVRLSCFR
jgi:hypothetical protein